MSAFRLVRPILHGARRTAILACVGVAVVVAVVAWASHSAYAQVNCPPASSPGCSYGGAPVPCSNTTYCYEYSGPSYIQCTEGLDKVAVAYRNVGPPDRWARCNSFLATSGSCQETSINCGTTQWYWYRGADTCISMYKCTAKYYFPYCKGPTLDCP